LVDLPWKPENKLLDKDKDFYSIKAEFSQMVGRIKDGNNKEYSFAFVIGQDFDTIKKHYKGEAQTLKIGKMVMTSHSKTTIEVLKDNKVDLEYVGDVARLIDSSSLPSDLGRNIPGKPHIKYKDYIRKKRREK